MKAYDWLRGLAVPVMLQTHALSLLEPSLRQGPGYHRLVWLDGLVAPSFTLASGFALALVLVRAAASGQVRSRALKSLRRIGEVLLIATLMTWVWFPIFREPKYLLRIDILSCIGLTLLLVLPLFAALARWPRVLAGASLGLAAASVLLAPLGQLLDPPLAYFLGTKTGSQFPLVPWSAYILLGGSLGAVAALGSVRKLAAWNASMAALGGLLWLVGAWLMPHYPGDRGWMAPNHAQRWLVVSLVALALLLLENGLKGSWQKSRPVRFLEVFGTSSLSAYFIHEILLYTRAFFGFSFQGIWGKSASWALYWPLVALLIAMTFAGTWAVARVYDSGPRIRAWLAVRASRRDKPVPGPAAHP